MVKTLKYDNLDFEIKSTGSPERVSVICLMHAPAILANFINSAVSNPPHSKLRYLAVFTGNFFKIYLQRISLN